MHMLTVIAPVEKESNRAGVAPKNAIQVLSHTQPTVLIQIEINPSYAMQ